MRFLVLLFPCLLAGQTFGCFETPELPGAGDAELHRGEQIKFTPIADPARIAGIRKLPSKMLGGFGPSYPVRAVTFFAAVKTTEHDRLEPDTVDLFVEAGKQSGESLYYQLTAPKTDSATSGDFPFTDGITEVRLGPATPDRAVPLVVLQTYGLFRGMHGQAGVRTRHVLDFRRAEPRSLIALECTDMWTGGACTVFDSGFSQQHSLACVWAPEHNDFLCTQETMNPLDWGSVGWKESFYLLSGTAAPPPGVAADGPSTPQEWVTKSRTKSVVLPGYGETHFLISLDTHTALLASRGNTGSLEPRFLLVTPSRTTEIATQGLAPDPIEPRFEPPLEKETPGVLSGAPMNFAVKPLLSAPKGLRFFQVTLTQDKHHSVFWVGADCRTGDCAVDALWLATDALEYDHCRRSHIPDSAARATWIGKGDVLARLDVEPMRYLDFDEQQGYYRKDSEGPELPCAYGADLRWSEGRWVPTRKERPCDPAKVHVRAIAISSQGALSAAPAKMCEDCQL